MIGRRRAQLHRQPRAAQADKLIGMNLQPIAQRRRRFQDAPRLGQVEGALLAEHVAEEGDAALAHPGRAGGQGIGQQVIDVGVGVAAELGRYGVGGQEGRRQFDGLGVVEGHDGVELAQFGRRLQAVARLGLGAGRAIAQHPRQPRQVVGHQLGHVGGTGAPDGGHDAPAGGHDRHVRRPAEALLELARPVAQPGQMGVGIDEAGHDTVAGGVERGRGAIASAQLGRRPDGHHAPFGRGQRAIGQQAQVAQGRAPLRPAVAGHDAQLRRRMDKKIDVFGHDFPSRNQRMRTTTARAIMTAERMLLPSRP